VFLEFINNHKPKLGNHRFIPMLVNLVGRNVGDSGAISLAQALEINNTVTRINL